MAHRGPGAGRGGGRGFGRGRGRGGPGGPVVGTPTRAGEGAFVRPNVTRNYLPQKIMR
jgi:hypothetical protein